MLYKHQKKENIINGIFTKSIKNRKKLKNTKALNNVKNISQKSIIHLFSSKLISFFF